MSNPMLPSDMEALDEKSIFFQSEGIPFELTHPLLIITWIEQVIKQEEKFLQTLNFIFCNDAYLHQINLEYLQHDTYTDIITFPYQKPPIIEGDIFISVERVKENAQSFKVTFKEELHRVIIHGVLHLCGHMDKTPEENRRMRKKENEALQLLQGLMAD